MKQKIKSGEVKYKSKIRSKRGLTLIEILVGVAIVVIVFASTLGAMVSGYTTTLYNADENRAAILNASVNEIVLNTFKNMKIGDADSATDIVDSISDDYAAMTDPESAFVAEDSYAMAVISAVNAKIPEAVFVPAALDSATGKYVTNFAEGESYQYTLIPESKTTLSFADGSKDDYSVDGVKIITCFESANGSIISETFIPYSKS